jgi:beta-galactosidase
LNASRVASAAAIAFSWPNWWALELGSKPSAEIQMLNQLRWMYRPVWEGGATADFVRPDEAGLSGYPLLLVPSLYLLTEPEANYICSFVRSGGTAVISFWSGIVNESEQVYLGGYGGPLRELFGGAVLDVAPLQPGETVELAWADGRRSPATHWQDIIEPGAGEVLARYASGPWAGRPAVLEHHYGDGRVIYLGTRLDQADMRELIGPLLVEQPPVPSGVERVVREADPVSYEFLLNHTNAPVSLPAAPGGTDLLTNAAVAEQLTLPPQGVAIVRRP